jgi:hypothetical protein
MTERAMQLVLGFTAAWLLVTGVMGLVAPDTFFDEIGKYGVENSHYVGDVGAFQTAAGLGILVAIWRPAWRAPLLWVGAAWFLLHALNHAFDTSEARSEGRGWLDTILLALGGIGSGFLARDAARLQREAEPAGDSPTVAVRDEAPTIPR